MRLDGVALQKVTVYRYKKTLPSSRDRSRKGLEKEFSENLKKGIDILFRMRYDGATRKPHTDKTKEENTMNMSEAARVIIGLRAAGWSEKEINDFILWIETGEEQYKPKLAE